MFMENPPFISIYSGLPIDVFSASRLVGHGRVVMRGKLVDYYRAIATVHCSYYHLLSANGE